VLGLVGLHHQFHGSPIDYVTLAAAAAASWVGLPGPGEPLLIAAAILAAHHHLDIASVIVVATVAAMAGGVVGWLIGLTAGRAVYTVGGPLHTTRRKALARGEEVFAKHPVLGILLTPSWIAGIHRVRPRVYLLINAVSAVLWGVGIGLAAFYVGPSVVEFVDDLGVVTGVGAAVLVLAVVAGEIARRRHRGHHRPAS
jgi:membrane protein DedA with SNARE-associated domain